MKRLSVLLGFLAISLVVSSHAFAAEGKFGYVDLQEVLNGVSEGKNAKSEIETTYKKRQSELDALQKNLEGMKKELEKDRLVLSADALQKKEEAYRESFLELTQKMNQYKMELAQKESETTGSILNALRRVVQTVGEKDGYTMILETSQDVVLFSPRDADLTRKIIQEYNKLPKSQRRVSSR